MTLKELLNKVQERSRETPETVYASNNKPRIRRLIQYANQANKRILAAHKWSYFKKQGVVNVIDGTTLYSLPSDFYRLVNDTMHRGSTFVPINFVASSQDVALQNNYNTGKLNTGRIVGGQLELINFPAGQVTYEYISNGLVQLNATGGSTLSVDFTEDNDTFLYPNLDELLVCATHWLYQRSKGGETANEAKDDYIIELRAQRINDTGSRIIDNTGPKYNRLTPPFNPDYGY